ncbi:MAG: hypothetical protein MK052_03840 [Alphaproteobacteria bacterium]|nr:hypothetical protein [Alphaproteobacteria bacterium]
MKKNLLWPVAISALYCVTSFYTAQAEDKTLLQTPTLELRQEAMAEFADGDASDAKKSLYEAMELAREQKIPYVKANELRYIADAWSKIGVPLQASKAFAESMEAAIATPTWNHRLYASIGVVEMQRATGDMDGTYRNGMKALDSGLMEAVAETGEAAEMGRFFTAMNGLLTRTEREKLKQRIKRIGNAQFQSKAIHALDAISVKRGL